MKYNKEKKDILIEKYLDLCKENSINITPEKVAVLVRGRSGLNGKDYSKIKELWQTPITFLLAQATYYKGIQNVEKTVSVIEKILYYIIFESDANVTDFKEIQKIYSIKEWNLLVFKLSIRLPNSSITLKSWKQAIIAVVDNFILENNIQCKNNVEIKTKSRVKDNNLKDFLEQPIEVFLQILIEMLI